MKKFFVGFIGLTLVAGAAFADENCASQLKKILGPLHGAVVFHSKEDAQSFLNTCGLKDKNYNIVSVDAGSNRGQIYFFDGRKEQ